MLGDGVALSRPSLCDSEMMPPAEKLSHSSESEEKEVKQEEEEVSLNSTPRLHQLPDPPRSPHTDDSDAR